MNRTASIHLLFAHTNEDISYLDNIKYSFTLISNHSIPVEQYPNNGWETTAYLKYIIDNYDNLTDYTVFLHGHLTSWHREIPTDKLINNTIFNTEYFNFNPKPQFQTSTFDLPRFKESYPIIKYKLLALIGDDVIPGKPLYYYPCAEFYVTRDLIHRNSKLDYINLYDQLYCTNEISSWYKGFCLEQLWAYMFFKDIYAPNFQSLTYNAESNIYELTNISNGHVYKKAYAYNNDIETLKINEGITTIRECAFYTCNNLKIVNLPDTVERIERAAFANCKELLSINIPKSIQYIDPLAFIGCENLRESVGDINAKYSIKNYWLYDNYSNTAIAYCKNLMENILLPDECEQISKRSDCSIKCFNLRILYLGKNFKKFDVEMFADANNLENIYVNPENKYYTSVNGILFNKNKTELVKFPSAKNIDKYEIPENVLNISPYAFRKNKYIKTLHLPHTITSIHRHTFAHSKIENINFHDNLKVIEECAFENAVGIKHIKFEKSLLEIHFSAFARCKNLESIDFGNSFPGITWWAFTECHKVNKVRIPDTVTELNRIFDRNIDNIEFELYEKDK